MLATKQLLSNHLKLAIIGSGPSAFYAAARVLSSLPSDSNEAQVQVHMYERLPTPHGLVRYGVAPDHPDVKVRNGKRARKLERKDKKELGQMRSHVVMELSLCPREISMHLESSLRI